MRRQRQDMRRDNKSIWMCLAREQNSRTELEYSDLLCRHLVRLSTWVEIKA